MSRDEEPLVQPTKFPTPEQISVPSSTLDRPSHFYALSRVHKETKHTKTLPATCQSDARPNQGPGEVLDNHTNTCRASHRRVHCPAWYVKCNQFWGVDQNNPKSSRRHWGIACKLVFSQGVAKLLRVHASPKQIGRRKTNFAHRPLAAQDARSRHS